MLFSIPPLLVILLIVILLQYDYIIWRGTSGKTGLEAAFVRKFERFSKRVEKSVFAVVDQEAETVAKKLMEQWVSRFGVIQYLHTDQGREFESKVFQEEDQNDTISSAKPRTGGREQPYHQGYAIESC